MPRPKEAHQARAWVGAGRNLPSADKAETVEEGTISSRRGGDALRQAPCASRQGRDHGVASSEAPGRASRGKGERAPGLRRPMRRRGQGFRGEERRGLRAGASDGSPSSPLRPSKAGPLFYCPTPRLLLQKVVPHPPVWGGSEARHVPSEGNQGAFGAGVMVKRGIEDPDGRSVKKLDMRRRRIGQGAAEPGLKRGD